MALKSFVEACLVLEEGLCTTREIDLGLMAGAGMDPRRGLLPPFIKADVTGLDVVVGGPAALGEGRGDGPRRRARAPRGVGGGPRRALRPADDPAAAGRPGPPRHEVRPGLLR